MNRKDLAGAIIHDLKNQLHSVLTEGEKVIRDIPEEYRDTLRPVFARSRRVHQDAMQLVTLYRMQEKGNFPSDDAWPSDTMKHAVECFQVHWPEVQVQIDIDPDCQGYYNDSLMHMALGNLLTNSAQAGATQIHVSATEEGSGLVIRFEDNGPGFDEAVLEQAQAGTGVNSGKEGGTGMGLYFTELIVNHHGTASRPAVLTLRNRNQGGALVEIRLP